MSFNSLLNQTGTIANKGAIDRHGKLAYGTATSVRMRFEKIKKFITTATKDDEPIDGKVFVGPAVSVDTGDKLVFDGIDYKVMLVSPIILGNGQTHHKELLVQEKNV